MLHDQARERLNLLPGAIREASSWADVARRLGYGGSSGSAYATMKRAAVQLGVDTSHLPDAANARVIHPSSAIPFARQAADERLRSAAIGEAVSWFLRRGYTPSLPVEPTRYDIVVESDEGLKKVQVKTTTRQKGGRFQVGVSRMEYRAVAASTTNVRRVRATYTCEDVDFFFVITSGGDRYLIPTRVVGGHTVISLGEKYRAFLVP
ncbi:hypothetical protein GCM10009687_36410 [Asanoa iriomotensis]|uniref:PD(D/E)XK endonuclease domain-containing protein n=1 Tax=Asanoa iriomotensis TaxID=234613 RepID=A0ABQ4CB51_9ACTN|nr:hypothetical protein Air01nite_60780 [Asanoa iriomotensis]